MRINNSIFDIIRARILLPPQEVSTQTNRWLMVLVVIASLCYHPVYAQGGCVDSETFPLLPVVQGCVGLANTGDTIYAATSGYGVYRTFDHGATWQELSAGLNNVFLRAIYNVNGSVYCISTASAFLFQKQQQQWVEITSNGIPIQGIRFVVGDGQYHYAINSAVILRMSIQDDNITAIDTVLIAKKDKSMIGQALAIYAQTRNDAHPKFTPKGLYTVVSKDTVVQLLYSQDQGKSWSVFIPNLGYRSAGIAMMDSTMMFFGKVPFEGARSLSLTIDGGKTLEVQPSGCTSALGNVNNITIIEDMAFLTYNSFDNCATIDSRGARCDIIPCVSGGVAFVGEKWV